MGQMMGWGPEVPSKHDLQTQIMFHKRELWELQQMQLQNELRYHQQQLMRLHRQLDTLGT
jgi:hypothetical protein